jgi:hypothetical protein
MTITTNFKLFVQRYYQIAGNVQPPVEKEATPSVSNVSKSATPAPAPVPAPSVSAKEMWCLLSCLKEAFPGPTEGALLAAHLKKTFPFNSSLHPVADLTHVHDMTPLRCGQDFHCWVVGRDGKVIYDPYFKEYDCIRRFQKCWGKQHHCEWDLDYQKLVWKDVKRRARMEMAEAKKQGATSAMVWKTREAEKPFHCATNSMCFVRNNRGKGYRIAIGSMGWKRLDGRVHWEYGDGLTRKGCK